MDDGDDDTYTYIGDDCKYVIPPEFVEDDRENPPQTVCKVKDRR